jgi:hypothetical protein
MKLITLSPLVARLFMPMIVRADNSVTKITKLPYTITASGNYEMTRNWSVASDKVGIVVEAPDGSNVVINLGGFLITARTTGGNGFGVYSDHGNTVVYNGTISGFGTGLFFGPGGGKAHDLRLLGNSLGMSLGGNNIVVQDCSIIGTGAASFAYGILIVQNANVQVTGCHISKYIFGILSMDQSIPNAAGNVFNGNYVASCTYGLKLFPNDYYQGNLVTNCTTSFSGGNSIGTENGGN